MERDNPNPILLLTHNYCKLINYYISVFDNYPIYNNYIF